MSPLPPTSSAETTSAPTPVAAVGGMRRLRAGLPVHGEPGSTPLTPRHHDQFVHELQKAVEIATEQEHSVLVVRVRHRPLPSVAVANTSNSSSRSQLPNVICERLTAVAPGFVGVVANPEEFIGFVPSLRRRADGEAIMDGLLEGLKESLSIDQLPHAMSARLGGVLLDHENPTADHLLEAAELALAESDDSRRGVLFHPYQRVRSERQRELESELRLAVVNQAIGCAMQPAVDITTGKIVAIEAFARWSRGERGPVPAPDLILAAEALGVIHEISLQVLERAHVAAARLTDEGVLSGITLWINVGPAEILHPDFAGRFLGVMRRDERITLGLEVSPSPDADDRASAGVLRALASRGARVAIGDFGVGYSNFAAAHEQPYDSIKLDRRLVAQLGSSEQATNTVRLMVELAHTMGLEITAQGVESESQVTHLRSMNVPLAQGHLVARPSTPEEFDAMIHRLTAG